MVAIVGAVVASGGAVIPAALTDAVNGASAVAAGGSTGATAGSAGVVGGLLTGPVGWTVLGAEPSADAEDAAHPAVRWTCWKAVVRDEGDSTTGRTLRWVAAHPSVRKVTLLSPSSADDTVMTTMPQFCFENVWGEAFRVAPVALPDGSVAYHAARAA